jgi:GMP synthase (glutamine-hydrolysing)
MKSETETLLILDYGSQYTQLIARRARELNIFSVVLPFDAPLGKLAYPHVKGIILSGGPNSVYETGAPHLQKAILERRVPVLGICYGLHLLSQEFGGNVIASKVREYGLAKLDIIAKSTLLPAEADGSQVWMSHGDHAETAPAGFRVTAKSGDIICALENDSKKLYALQFHPEVSHSRFGTEVLQNFADICGFSGDWTPESFIQQEVARIKKVVGDVSVICALSGGVDSSVAATLVHKAIGSRQTCIFVDTGLLRQNEYDDVLAVYKSIGLNVKPIRAGKQFLAALKGVTDPEEKRKTIGHEFIKVFDAEAKKIKDAHFLVQGTLYPDVIESVSVHGPSATIKSHHNVGGLPKDMKLKLIEPLRELFKDEVRAIGAELGLPSSVTQRQPFPGPGLGVRILGEITEESVTLLQAADAIVRAEIEKAGLAPSLWQFFAVLLPVQSVGVMGDGRTYEKAVVVRAVESTDAMTANWAQLPHDVLATISSRIISEVKGVNRVVYDITSKPPGTIEWE